MLSKVCVLTSLTGTKHSYQMCKSTLRSFPERDVKKQPQSFAVLSYSTDLFKGQEASKGQNWSLEICGLVDQQLIKSFRDFTANGP